MIATNSAISESSDVLLIGFQSMSVCYLMDRQSLIYGAHNKEDMSKITELEQRIRASEVGGNTMRTIHCPQCAFSQLISRASWNNDKVWFLKCSGCGTSFKIMRLNENP